jgi:hypothetical protein
MEIVCAKGAWLRCIRGGGVRTLVSASYAKCCIGGFLVAETQRTVFVMSEAHKTCIFFFKFKW